jgi:hypothetical protein
VTAGKNVWRRLQLFQSRLDLCFPDDVCRFLQFNAHLAGLCGIRVADPGYFIAGAPVMALDKDELAHLLDPGNCSDASSMGRYLIRAAGMRFKTLEVRKYLHGNRNVKSLLITTRIKDRGLRTGDRFRRDSVRHA